MKSLCRTSVLLELWLDANGAFDAWPDRIVDTSENETTMLCRSLALHVPTASSTRCSQRSRKPPNTKEKRTQESIAPNKLRVATLGSQQQTKETCLTLRSMVPKMIFRLGFVDLVDHVASLILVRHVALSELSELSLLSELQIAPKYSILKAFPSILVWPDLGFRQIAWIFRHAMYVLHRIHCSEEYRLSSSLEAFSSWNKWHRAPYLIREGWLVGAGGGFVLYLLSPLIHNSSLGLITPSFSSKNQKQNGVKCIKKYTFYKYPVKVGQLLCKNHWFFKRNGDFEVG